jgi:primosomal protein N' (replication factor Y)
MYVRVRPDVFALDDTFVYSIPEKFEKQISIGALVRVPMHGRRVNGWITDIDVTPEESRSYSELLSVRSVGPPQNVLELADWASWRWAGSATAFLDAASPDTMVKSIPFSQSTNSFQHTKLTLVERAPHEAKGDLLLEASKHKNALLLFPTFDQAKGAQLFLRNHGVTSLRFPDDWAAIRSGGGVVVGTRRAVWAPLESVDAAVVIDAHDHRYKEERAPTWNAVDIVVKRAFNCTLVSPCPTTVIAYKREIVVSSREDERNGWPQAEVVDMRAEDPRKGLWSDALVKQLRKSGNALVLLNRKGRAQLLICDACNNVAVCEKCAAHVHEVNSELICNRCNTKRPLVCQSCHAQRLRRRRIGVSRAREELEALLSEPVAEITKETDEVTPTRVTIGTEAALYRIQGDLQTIAFVDFDQELLAPIVGAAERAMSLCARAARLVPPRKKGGTFLIQTRVPHHEVVDALQLGDPSRVREAELQRRRILSLPPFTVVALIEGKGAEEFVRQLPETIDILGPKDDHYLIRAENHQLLCDELAKCKRPAERVRIDVDPLWF